MTKAGQDRLYSRWARWSSDFGASKTEQQDFRRGSGYVRITRSVADLDLRGWRPRKALRLRPAFRRLIPAEPEELPREVQQNIDMESYRLQQTGSGAITLQRTTA